MKCKSRWLGETELMTVIYGAYEDRNNRNLLGLKRPCRIFVHKRVEMFFAL